MCIEKALKCSKSKCEQWFSLGNGKGGIILILYMYWFKIFHIHDYILCVGVLTIKNIKDKNHSATMV